MFMYVFFRSKFKRLFVRRYKSSKRLYMLMECVQGGELYSRIHMNKSGGLSTAEVSFYAACIAVALNHLHSKDICYRDLKPEVYS